MACFDILDTNEDVQTNEFFNTEKDYSDKTDLSFQTEDEVTLDGTEQSNTLVSISTVASKIQLRQSLSMSDWM